ncbi:MAG: SDR family oxidoreductase [Acidimicrobiia bacterium]|nr:SDR family oxidoreductase [Acidimicrobiia bacterium]
MATYSSPTASATTALVTGAAGHLGSAITRLLVGRAITVAVNDVDATAARRLVESVDGAVPFIADVSLADEAVRLVTEVVERLGPIDVLVNGVGVEGPLGAVEEIRPNDVRRAFEVNVMSMFWLCRAIVGGMKRRGRGRIINVASGAGLAGGALASPYHASKHAVVGLTRSLARELGPHQIPVNAVCPGYVESPMVDRILDAETALTGERADVVATIPMARMASADEVAATVAFLALDAPSYLTGQCVVIDGGLRA